METLKINYIMYTSERTGGNRSLFHFMNELVKLGHEVSVTTLYFDDWFPLDKDITVRSISPKFKLYYFYGTQILNRKKKILRHMYFLSKLMDLVPKVDINVATFSTTAYIASWKSIDGSTPFYHMQHFETIMSDDPLMKKFISDTYFLPMYKIVNSIWLRNKIQEFTGKEYHIVTSAISHDTFYPRINGFNEKKTESEVNIVALGKGGWKSATGIYNAVEKVRNLVKSKKIILHYFGHVPPKSVPFDSKYNVFHKDISDDSLALLYSTSDIQITFSTAESFPSPPLEAMACGSAVITTPYGTEDYAVNGENALIVEPNNVDMLTEKIRVLIDNEDLRNKLKKNGLKTAKRYSYSGQAKILEAELKSALDEYALNSLKTQFL